MLASILRLAAGLFYWPLAIVVCSVPFWIVFATSAVDMTWLAIVAAIGIFLFMSATWDHVVRPRLHP